MSDWAKEMEEEEEALKCQLPATETEYDSGKGTKRETSYQKDEDGIVYKVISEYKVETRKLNKSVARRKEWKKYGASEADGPGPNSANTYPGEEVFLQFVYGRTEDEAEKLQQGEETNKLPKNIATCRICKGAHFTTKCPYKDRQEVLGLGIGEGSDTDKSGPPPVSKEAGGKYIPPGLRQSAGAGMSADKRREDQPTIRVTNLPEDTTEDDLSNLFSPFGKIHRIFLAKDKQTLASKGFAFITYQRREDAQKAIAGVSGYGYGHLILKVEWARPSNE